MFQRSTNLIACVGHTPPQVWQSVQSVTRVVKSGLIASNGQISTHLLQWMQVDSTLRSVTRNRFPSENTAPLGQTYLHQNRGRRKPRPRTTKNRAIETTCPPRSAGPDASRAMRPSAAVRPRNNNPRVITGIAAT